MVQLFVNSPILHQRFMEKCQLENGETSDFGGWRQISESN